MLLLTDRVDEWLVTAPHRVRWQAAAVGGAGHLDVSKLGEATSKVADEFKEDEFKDLLTRMQDVLKDRASSVRLTHRLTDSPACLVGDEHGMSRHLERILRESGQTVPVSKPVLEINPDHPVVQRLKQESDSTLFADWSHILFDQALLAEGGDARGSRDVREAAQRADAGARGRGSVENLGAGELSVTRGLGQDPLARQIRPTGIGAVGELPSRPIWVAQIAKRT